MAVVTPEHGSQGMKLQPKKSKSFAFSILKGLWCGGFSSPAAMAQSRAPEKKQKQKKKKKKGRRKRENVCCRPPGIGFTYDVATSTTPDAHRRNHTKRSSTRRVVDVQHTPCSNTPQTRDQSFVRSNISDARQYNRLRRRSARGTSEIVMFRHNPLVERSFDGSDRFEEWRLNVDIMSYEELVELSERIGNVGVGLQEEDIRRCIRRPKQSFFSSFSFKSKAQNAKCSICQEECKGEQELGKLECGHCHHMDCIKQWLLQKNACPICKTAAKSTI